MMGILKRHDGETIPTLQAKHDPSPAVIKHYWVVWDDILTAESDSPAAGTPSSYSVSPAGALVVDAHSQPGAATLEEVDYTQVTRVTLSAGTGTTGDIVTVTNEMDTTSGQTLHRSFKIELGDQ
jgi:hypothetical protein